LVIYNSKYKRRWINVFFYCVLGSEVQKGFVNRAFIQMFKQYNISYNGQRFQQSTKFDYSVSIIEYNVSIEPIYQYNTYYS
jgi:hypothetical protein